MKTQAVSRLPDQRPENEQPSSATRVLELVSDCELFHDQLNRPFIRIRRGGHFENWSLEDDRLTHYLTYQFHKAFGSTVAGSAVKDAISALRGKALYEGELRETAIRTATHEGIHYIDRCDPDWSAIEVAPGQWTVRQQSPAAFYRCPTAQPLPIPARGGSIKPLWELINVPEQYRLLVLTFLLECWRPDTPYPLLVIQGEQGSAKSSTQRLLKALVDPSAMPLRLPPKRLEDVMVATGNDLILSFNNLSYLNGEFQDALCCFSTGGTFSTRKLYTNSQEAVTNVMRPIMLNGIGGLLTRPDLMERCICLELPRIEQQARMTDVQINDRFARLHPQLLGALLDLMAKALELLPSTPGEELPRMADFALLGRSVAMAQGLSPAAFDQAYELNQREVLERGLDACPIYPALAALLDDRAAGFSGTYKELMDKLDAYRDRDAPGWPRNPRKLADVLKRQAPAYRRVGIAMQFDNQRRSQGYVVSIQRHSG